MPAGRIRSAMARRLLRRVAARMPIRVLLPSGESFGGGGPAAPALILRRPGAFYRRVGARGLIGFGESYMAGDWDADDLTGLLTTMARRIDTLVPPRLQWLRRVYVSRPPADWDADEAGARQNVRQHYDLSNDLFALFLDETMTYSAALFESDDAGAPVTASSGAPGDALSSLAAAQRRKIDRLLDVTGTGPGTRLLEIGTGWGELAIRAARRGAVVRTITVSAEQHALAAERVAAAGLAGRVAVELCDYREVTGQFDVIVSVEMIEAVAERYWPEYFRVLDRLLAPGGRVGLQAITMPHERMMATRRTQTWILKYVFPGGLIPSVQAIEASMAGHTRLRVAGRRDFGSHYAETLRIWRERFCANADAVGRLGFDEVFRRMWTLYLSYSEAGFRSGYLQASQFLLSRPGPGTPGQKISKGLRQNNTANSSRSGKDRRVMSGQTVTAARPSGGAAAVLFPVAQQLLRGDLPLRLRAWDGSEAGPETPVTIVLRSRQALRRMLWHPGELGLAQAYVTGELDVEGDITEGLRAVWQAARDRGLAGARLPAAGWTAAVRAAIALRIPGPRPAAPATEARVSGRLHSRSRDRAVISHHYDVPAAFYELILDPQMAYSCALWTSSDPGYALADAQRDKLDTVCRQLRLGPGMRLLDVGCGWGSLAIHAARSYGTKVTAVTLAGEQAAFVRRRIGELGLGDKVTVAAADYRDIPLGEPYDAAASIEMGEHVGKDQYPAFCRQLRRQLRPGGRLLIQQMSRPARTAGGGKFIEAYIAPDMHMRPVGETIGLLEDAGLEVVGVRAMREQYTTTIRAWLANLERQWDAVTALIGPESARVWRLYLAGGALAFDEGRMGVHQIAAVRS
jgi:cyclopropane-fatty-acyl-phospholipid synthase